MFRLLLLFLLAVALQGCLGTEPTASVAPREESTPTSARTPPQPNCPKVDFSFVQTYDWLQSSKVRKVEFYVPPEAFSKKNLRLLFACISQANPEPIHLIAKVETDWSRVHIPSGAGTGTGASNMPPDPHEYDFLQAIYFREQKEEWFRYSPAIHVDQYYFRTVKIR